MKKVEEKNVFNLWEVELFEYILKHNPVDINDLVEFCGKNPLKVFEAILKLEKVGLIKNIILSFNYSKT